MRKNTRTEKRMERGGKGSNKKKSRKHEAPNVRDEIKNIKATRKTSRNDGAKHVKGKIERAQANTKRNTGGSKKKDIKKTRGATRKGCK